MDPRSTPARSEADARMAALIERFADEEGVTVRPPGRGFGAGALQVDGRIFAMVSAGRLVLKLPEARVLALTAAGHGIPFDAGKGRPMREWIALADGAGVDRLALGREALWFVRRRTP